MRRLLALAALTLAACPAPSTPDGGGDDGGPPAACDNAGACKAAGAPGVCRQGQCLTHVPCSDDLECGIGELCASGECVFQGCVANSECPTGLCRLETFSCAECGADSDCPSDRPVCQLPAQRCVQCADDSQCPEPGPGHCEALTGTCQGCTQDAHCPSGFKCQGGVCTGAHNGQACSSTIACSAGLTCVQLTTSTGSTRQVCLQSCDVYASQCPAGTICSTLKFTGTSSYVFDMGGLLGVCVAPGSGRGYRDSCILSDTGASNCQPSLQCVPDSPATATCRAYCDPGQPNACPAPESCHTFTGDFSGRDYGLCYPNNGYGTPCTSNKGCADAGAQSCVPYDDPSSFEGLSLRCQFNVGSAPALAACHDVHLVDGGVTLGNKTCASGSCVSDKALTMAPYFCFGACTSDSDCSIAGRTGTCDQTYKFTASDGTEGNILGCRPGCLGNSSCVEYADAGSPECQLQLVTSSTGGGLKHNCGRPIGFKDHGMPCASDGECLSGFCLQNDARGVRRPGYCIEACQAPTDCPQGPLVGISCQPTAFLGNRGPDGDAGTADDQIIVSNVCNGLPCQDDSACQFFPGSLCAPDVDPADAGNLVLRCRPHTLGPLTTAAPCSADSDCASGACAALTDAGTRACFTPCLVDGGTTFSCPGANTCRPGAFRLTATGGASVLMDGCAP